MELSSTEITYLITSFLFALFLAIILILIKVNFKESSISSVFFAVFFLAVYFYQPLLLIVDKLKSYTLYYSIEKPHFAIEDFLNTEYTVVGYVGTFFSNFFLPIHRDITISGYDTICKRLKDAIIRYFKKKKILIIIGIAYILLSLILYKVEDNDEEIPTKSIQFVRFLLNCLIVKDFFKAIWLLGAYFPLLVGDLRLEMRPEMCCCFSDICDSNTYSDRLKSNIEESLEKDKKKLTEAYENVIYITRKFLTNSFTRGEIENLLNVLERDQGKYQIKLKSEDKIKQLEKPFNPKNSVDELASAVRNLFKTASKIPRKIYEYEDVEERREKGICNMCYHLYYGIIIIGVFIFGFEISLSYYDYDTLSSPLNFDTNFVFNFFLSYLYFILIYYSFLKKNSLTTQNIYGIKQSDSLCLLKFAEVISGLITPVSFIVVGTKAFGFFYLRENMTFMETFNIPLVENIFIGLKYDEVYDSYITLRTTIFIFSFCMTFVINTISVPLCCKKGKYIINWYINDKNAINIFDENGCCKKCYGEEDDFNLPNEKLIKINY